MIQIGQRELYLENDFIYISAEITPAYQLFGTTVERPHAAIVLDSLIETHPEACNASAVTVKVSELAEVTKHVCASSFGSSGTTRETDKMEFR